MAVFKGESISLEVTVLDKDDNPEDLTALVDYQATLYFQNEETIDKYRKVPASGFLKTIAVDELNGKFKILVEGSRTAEINEGRMLLDVKILGSDAEFEDGNFRLVDSDIFVEDLEGSPSQDDLL